MPVWVLHRVQPTYPLFQHCPTQLWLDYHKWKAKCSQASSLQLWMVPGASYRLLPHLHWRTGLSYTLSLLDQPCCSLDLLHLSLTSFPEHDVSWLSPNATKPPSRDTINSAAVCPVLCNQQYPNRSSSVILHSKAKLTSVLLTAGLKGLASI